MEPWLIILITVSSGAAAFGLIFFIKNRKEKKRQNTRNAVLSMPVVMVPVISNNNFVPSTDRAPAYNMRRAPVMIHQPSPMHGQQIHPGSRYPGDPFVTSYQNFAPVQQVHRVIAPPDREPMPPAGTFHHN